MLTTILLLILFGLILLAIEFILPGAIIGILGVAAMATAVVLTFSEYGSGPGCAVAAGAILVTILFIVLWLKFFHRTYFGKKFTLQSKVGGTGQFDEKRLLVGATGVAACDLRPSGRALIDGRKVDVVADAGLIEKDSPIRVIKVEGVRVVVEGVAAPQAGDGVEKYRPH